MENQLTETEAMTLAAMLQNAAHAMARTKVYREETRREEYVWNNTAIFAGGEDPGAFADMYRGFYDIVPPQYGIYL